MKLNSSLQQTQWLSLPLNLLLHANSSQGLVSLFSTFVFLSKSIFLILAFSTTKSALYKTELKTLTNQMGTSTLLLVKAALKSAKSPYDKVHTKVVTECTKNLQELISRVI